MSGTSKKALGEMLDTQVADFKRDGDVKKNPRGAGPKKNPEGTPQNTEAKKLQKDIKAFLISTFVLGFHSMFHFDHLCSSPN